jgi:serpin B
MRAVLLGLALSALSAVPAACAEKPAADKPTAEKSAEAAASCNAFGIGLYHGMDRNVSNVVCSPLSIDTVLMMTYAGAGGRTADEMAKVLALPGAKAEIDRGAVEAMAALCGDLNAAKGADGKPRLFKLTVANALWGQKGEGFLPDFLSFLKDTFGAGLTEIDFAADPAAATESINAWGRRQTHDDNWEVIPKGQLKADTRLVLASAVYFKGAWAKPFRKAATRNAPFHVRGPTSSLPHHSYHDADVPMMNRLGQYGYMETESMQGLKMMYAGDEISMVILLPKKVPTGDVSPADDPLTNLEASVTAESLAGWMKEFHSEEVEVAIPQFKVTDRLDIASVLSSMGMKDAFDLKAADFSGMNGKKDLHISAVVHRVVVDVNEEGTEAAATTAGPVATPSVGEEPRPEVFRADHPFLFLIRHEKTGAILFMGRVADPTH